MTNCLFYSIFFALFLNISFGSLRFSQINRTFLSIYKGMLEACVITVDTKGEPIKPIYNKQKVEDYVLTYLEENIKKYSKNFDLKTTYYDENFKNKTNVEIRGISITLNAKINSFYTYEKEQRFSIWSKDNLWTKSYYNLLKIRS